MRIWNSLVLFGINDDINKQIEKAKVEASK